jgi:hypothetical protein
MQQLSTNIGQMVAPWAAKAARFCYCAQINHRAIVENALGAFVAQQILRNDS